MHNKSVVTILITQTRSYYKWNTIIVMFMPDKVHNRNSVKVNYLYEVLYKHYSKDTDVLQWNSINVFIPSINL